ncbi:hypothetical protein KBA63_05990 [Candidatus Woesebacteria bacterium]|nr:hypothetical protein [Candidatus Woesebacteria bacterium]MBP9687674.1 hypothetical protein [Candidatus Woesebacteria bacterium]
MILLVLLTRILYFVENILGYTYYRDPFGNSSNNTRLVLSSETNKVLFRDPFGNSTHFDFFIKTDKVLFWEEQIREILNIGWGRPAAHISNEISQKCIIALAQCAADEGNYRGEKHIVDELIRRKFLNESGKFIDKDVQAIVLYAIKLSETGWHISGMRLKNWKINP